MIWDQTIEKNNMQAVIDGLRRAIKAIDAQSIATTDVEYVAVPSSLIVDAMRLVQSAPLIHT